MAIQYASMIRRENRRMISLANKFGIDSMIYQNEASKLDSLLPVENIRYNSDGVIQIANPKSLEQKGYTIGDLENLDIKTPTEIVKQYKEQYKEFKKENDSGMSLADFTENMQRVKNTFSNYFNSEQLQSAIKDAEERILERQEEWEEPEIEAFNKSFEAFTNQRATGVKPSYSDFMRLARGFDIYGL